MSLECLAILGSQNEPLYLCDTGESTSDSGEADVFGFSEANKNVSIRHEFMMHAALDRLEEMLGSHRNFNLAKLQRGSHWLGSICPMEDCEIYGFLTSTNIKILVLIQRPSVIPLERRKEVEIKALCKNIHACYVGYVMNPFTKIRSRVEPPCAAFDKGIRTAIQEYNDALEESEKVKAEP